VGRLAKKNQHVRQKIGGMGLEVGDLDFAEDGDNATLRVRRGKGNRYLTT